MCVSVYDSFCVWVCLRARVCVWGCGGWGWGVCGGGGCTCAYLFVSVCDFCEKLKNGILLNCIFLQFFGNYFLSGPLFPFLQVIIVQSEEAKAKLPAELRDVVVMTIFKAKGLEFDDVLLYNFVTDSQVRGIMQEHLMTPKWEA